MLDLSLIRDVVAILGVLVAFSYYLLTLRNQNMQRNAQLFMDYHNKITSNPLKDQLREVMSWEWQDKEDFEAKYGKLPDPETFFADPENPLLNLVDVLAYYEGLGVLMSRNHLDIELISRFGGYITYLWEKYEGIIYEWRRQAEMPYWWVEFENLYLKIREYRERATSVTEMTAGFESRRKALGLTAY
jgi:hypothetical protein